MQIRPATDADVPAVTALLRGADDACVISEASVRHWTATRPARARAVELVATEDDQVVAFGGAALNIWTTAAGAGQAFVVVTPERRRAGVGSHVGERLFAHLRDCGATTVTTFLRHTEEGERWAKARGFERTITGPLIAVDPRTTPAPELPDGFRIVTLAELTPEDVFDAMCEAALDEPSAEPNDAIELSEFVREWEDPLFDLGSATAVLHGDDVVAFAFMKVADDRAQHGFTGCARDYRGRGLATAAKRAALRNAAARGVTRVTTSNAEENTAMRAINRRLGFEQIGEHVILKRTL